MECAIIPFKWEKLFFIAALINIFTLFCSACERIQHCGFWLMAGSVNDVMYSTVLKSTFSVNLNEKYCLQTISHCDIQSTQSHLDNIICSYFCEIIQFVLRHNMFDKWSTLRSDSISLISHIPHVHAEGNDRIKWLKTRETFTCDRNPNLVPRWVKWAEKRKERSWEVLSGGLCYISPRIPVTEISSGGQRWEAGGHVTLSWSCVQGGGDSTEVSIINNADKTNRASCHFISMFPVM